MGSYKTGFSQHNLNVPTGSRSYAGVYGGSPCAQSISFGRGHGTAPMTGTVKFDGNFNATYGQKLTLRIGSSFFTGIVIYIHRHRDMDEGQVTEIRLVDMRDRLHDEHVYGQFNMIDSGSGVYYHILPVNWEAQIRTIIRKVEKRDFDTAEEKSKLDFACQFGLISAATIINELSKSNYFTWSASGIALKILKLSRPDNLDWNQGIRVIEALQAILDKNGLQMTFWGDLHCYITLKGWNDNPAMDRMMSQNICMIPGHLGDDKGGELNERGHRVAIIGDRNKYENYYPATPNWNLKFTLPVCLGWEQAALLEENALTLRSKLKELPEAWHDPEKWEGKPRNDMTIEDYINEICFKVYVVDMEYPIKNLYDTDIEEEGYVTLAGMNEKVTVKGKKTSRKQVSYAGGQNYRPWILTNDPFDPGYNSYFPVSDKLVSDSENQFVAFTSYKNIRIKGQKDPFDFDPWTVVPVIDGVSLDVEQVFDKDTCCERFRVRLIFSEMKYTLLKMDLPPNQVWQRSDLTFYGPDAVAVNLAVDKELFLFKAGDMSSRPRVREQKYTINGLHRNFIDDKEVALLSVFLQEMDIDQLVNADIIAVRIAAQALFHERVTTSGGMSLDRESGFQCDGLIDTVNINYDEENGIEESVQFTSMVNEISEPFVMGIALDRKIKDVKELVANELNKKRIEIAYAHKLAKKAAGNRDARKNRLGGHRAWEARSAVYGQDQTVMVKVTPAHLTEQGEFLAGEVMVTGSAVMDGVANSDEQVPTPLV